MKCGDNSKRLVVAQGGRLYGVLGGSGGIRIITTVAQVFLNQFVKKLDALTSVASTRVHHQVNPASTCCGSQLIAMHLRNVVG